jgi:hypothetical protein
MAKLTVIETKSETNPIETRMKMIRVVMLIVLGWLTLPTSVSAFYNPSTGRWLNRDPIDEPGFGQCIALPMDLGSLSDFEEDLNAYRLVFNDPPDRNDPLGLASRRPSTKRPKVNPCDGYKKYIPQKKCLCNCTWVPDPYTEHARKVCNGFMLLYDWSKAAQCVAKCLVAAEAGSRSIPWCSVRATVRLAAHVGCYAECGFIPYKGLPPGGADVGYNDLLGVLKKCKDPWNGQLPPGSITPE